MSGTISGEGSPQAGYKTRATAKMSQTEVLLGSAGCCHLYKQLLPRLNFTQQAEEPQREDHRWLEPTGQQPSPCSACQGAVAVTHPGHGSCVLDISSFTREPRGGRDSDLFVLWERERCQLSALLQQRELVIPLLG